MNDTGNRVHVWRVSDLHDAELLKGVYVRHSYPWHTHVELSLGLVVDGAIHLRTRSRQGTAKAGSFVLINSDEVHQGSPPTPEGWRCRTIHLVPEVIQGVADELSASGSAPAVWFDGPTFEDPALASAFLELHRLAEVSGSSLDRQTRITALIARLLCYHCRLRQLAVRHTHEPAAIRRAREYLDEHLSDKVTLDELAVAARLTPFRLLRGFRQALGLTPHNYQLQARVRKAHGLLRRGDSIADVSFAVGFADQAHLTRVFKSIMGGTPGQFRAASDLYSGPKFAG